MLGDPASPLFLEAVLEAMIYGVLVSDRAGNIVHSNAALIKLMHLDAFPRFLRLPLSTRLTLLQAFDEQGQAVSLEKWPLTRVLRGETLSGGRSDDLHIFLPDGTDIFVNHTGACIRDEKGEIIGAVLIIHDVSERHILESRIQQSFKILLALAEELVDLPVQISDPKREPRCPEAPEPTFHAFRTAGEYLAELTCQMLEYQTVMITLLDQDSGHMRIVAISGENLEVREQCYKQPVMLNPTDYIGKETLQRLRENEVVVETQHHQSHGCGSHHALLAPMLLDGCLVGILSVKKKELHASYTPEEFDLVKAIAKLILLVIERERIQSDWIEAHSSEMALREANRRFDEFLSIASHELRTPLTGIKGNLQLALRRLAAFQSDQEPDPQRAREKLAKVTDYLLQAEHRVNVQNRMIGDLLDVSRIQANKLELVIAPCDLLQIVSNAIKDQQYNVPERVLSLHAPEHCSFMVNGDADRLGQVIHNYLTNALKYSSSSRPVDVFITQQDDRVHVAVQDQGPGLFPEEQERVWERFYRVKDIPALGSGQGLGLGLHICRTIIEAHHGSFGLKSAPGQGSTFWFTLPLLRSPRLSSEQLFSLPNEHTPEPHAPFA